MKRVILLLFVLVVFSVVRGQTCVLPDAFSGMNIEPFQDMCSPTNFTWYIGLCAPADIPAGIEGCEDTTAVGRVNGHDCWSSGGEDGAVTSMTNVVTIEYTMEVYSTKLVFQCNPSVSGFKLLKTESEMCFAPGGSFELTFETKAACNVEPCTLPSSFDGLTVPYWTDSCNPDSYQWHIGLCAPAVLPPNVIGCPSSPAVVQLQDAACWGAGSVNGMVKVSNKKVEVTYPAASGDENFNDHATHIIFNCNTQVPGITPPLNGTQVCTHPGGVFTFVMESIAACTYLHDQSTHHTHHPLSGGWIFIITLCSVSVLYIAGGCAWNYGRKGKVEGFGCHMFPNSEFWLDLPKLVRDGCVFVFTCCGRKRRGYTEV